MSLSKLSLAIALTLMGATALAIGPIIIDPTLCPDYTPPQVPPWGVYPGKCPGNPVINLGDGGLIPFVDGGLPPLPAPPATMPTA